MTKTLSPLAPIDWQQPFSQWTLTLVQGNPDLRWQPHHASTARWERVPTHKVRVLVEGLRYFMPLAITSETVLSQDTQTAWEFTLTLEEPCAFEGMFQLVKDALDGFQIDWCLTPVDADFPRQKRLLISDMDSTLLEGECIDELAELMGCKAEVARITEETMNGRLDFESALIERVALLKGLPVEAVQSVLKSTPRMQGAKTLVQTMKQLGAFTLLVSGGFTPFTEALSCELGMEAHQANHLEVEDGFFTGRVIPPILGKEAKREALDYYAHRLGLGRESVLAIGDGANDVMMLEASGLGVAFHAKPNVQAQSRCLVRFNDLTALLYFQGIPQSAWSNFNGS